MHFANIYADPQTVGKVLGWAGSISYALCAIFSFSIAYADAYHANAVREDAKMIFSRFHPKNETLYFQGHWGFQYYMESLGASPIDMKSATVKPNDVIVIPVNNTALYTLPPDFVPLKAVMKSEDESMLSTMNLHTGAGFYSDVWGPMPYVFGAAIPDVYNIYEVRTGITFR